MGVPSPAPGGDGKALPDIPPKELSPVASPPQSPVFHQYVGRPPSQPGLYAYPYPPPMMSNSPYQPAFYPAAFASPPAPPFVHHPEPISRSGSTGTEDERTKLLEKVSSVLPDIGRLIHHYQETQGLLSEKDFLVKQAETQYESEITKLRIELSATKEEFERIIGEQASENVKLKGDMIEQAEKITLLENSLREGATAKQDLAGFEATCKSLEGEVETSRSLNEQLQRERGKLQSEVEDLKHKAEDAQIRYDEAVTAMKKEHESQLAETDDDHARALNDQKTSLSKMQLDLAGMITKHTQQRKDLESARATIMDREHALGVKTRELADTLDLHRTELEARARLSEETADEHKQEIQVWARKLAEAEARHEAQMETLRESHAKEMDALREAANRKCSELMQEHERREAQMQAELEAASSAVDALKTALNVTRQEKDGMKNELATERAAHESLRVRHETAQKHHAEMAESLVNLRTKQAEWQRESERMDRILHSLGQLGSSGGKGRGDQFL
jgi:chromosome segregation ATPase